MLFGNSLLWFIVLIWMFACATVHCQVCSSSTSDLDVFEGYQYVFYHEGNSPHRSFSDTRVHCKSLGGDMAVITSAEQNEFIESRLLDAGRNYWIGLEDLDGDKTYEWIDGTNLGYTNWDSDQYPANPPHCGCIRSRLSVTDPRKGKWNRLLCTSESRRRHICQIPINECSWHEFGEVQYLIDEGPATVESARATCQSSGGDLAMIKTSEIGENIKALIQSSSNCFWVGLQRQNDGTFTWLDGTISVFNNCDPPTTPNGLNSWGCLRSSSPLECQGQPADATLPFICERTRVFADGSKAYFGDTVYFISAPWMDRSYSDARTYCQYHGADLAVITSPQINTFLTRRATMVHSFTCFFFGLSDQASEGNFMWIDGTLLESPLWSPNEPNDNSPGEDCACLTTNGQWIDTTCTLKKPFICEQPRWAAISKESWVHFSGRFYYVSQSIMTSCSAARKFCQAQAGELAQPRTQAIQSFLLSLAGGESYWFGLDIQNGDFQWNDGSCLQNNTFNAWFDGSMGGCEEKCVHQSTTVGWSLRRCSCDLRFACERPLVLPVLSSLPAEYESGPNHVTIQWRKWDPSTDVGDGPATSYNVYVYSANGSLVQTASVDPVTDCPAVTCDFVRYDVTGLRPLETYTARMSVTREGDEGMQSQAIIIRTGDILSVTDNVGLPECQNLGWILFGVSMVGHIILAGVIIFLCLQKRKATSTYKLSVNPVCDDTKGIQHTYQDLGEVNKDYHDYSYTEIPEIQHLQAPRQPEYANT